MQTVTKRAEGRLDRPTAPRGDTFDPHFPGIRTAAVGIPSTQRPTVYDPYFPVNPRAKGSTHV